MTLVDSLRLPLVAYKAKGAYLGLISHPDRPRRLGALVLVIVIALCGLSRIVHLPRCGRNVPYLADVMYCGSDLIAANARVYGGLLVVYDARDQSRTTPHTYIDFNRKRIFLTDQIVDHVLQKQFKDILLLGLGGGAIPYMTTQKCTDCRLTGVDNSRDSLYITRRFGPSDYDNQQLTYILEDAEEYVKTGRLHTYDVVIVDLSVGTQMPSFVFEQSFIANARRLIKRRGQMIVTMYLHEHADAGKLKLYSALSKTFKSVQIQETEEHNPHFIVIASK